jgi:predicted negative regulator of RcsB-dependent stress response
VDRLTRKELKQDKFAQEIGHTVEYLGEHRRQLILFGGAGLLIIAIAAGVFYFTRHQHSVRQDQLQAALALMTAPVSPTPIAGHMTFATSDLRDRAVNRALESLASGAKGTAEGTMARYYLGTQAVGLGKADEAIKHLTQAVTGEKPYSSLAKLALAGVYRSQNRSADAERLLRELMNQPDTLVSKEQAQIELARVLAAGNPAEARKLLEPLLPSPGAVGRAANSAITELGLAN